MKQTAPTIFFDWNGTLFDDTLAVLEGFNVAFGRFGHACSLPQFRKSYDFPLESFFQDVGFSQKESADYKYDLLEAFHAAYAQLENKVHLRDGAKETLAQLHGAGVHCVLWSNHIIKPIEQQCARLGLLPYLDDLLANKDIAEQAVSLPKRARLMSHMDERELEKKKTMIVGDTPEEIRVAHEVGSTGVAITNGYASDERLAAVRPHHTIKLFAELPDIVTTVLGRGKTL
ncbi:MAG: HAD family hydrolase [Bdellovibrionales bacterium]|jgi:phosphoglycolate phosphatase-like HAD superfamily hydrolase